MLAPFHRMAGARKASTGPRGNRLIDLASRETHRAPRTEAALRCRSMSCPAMPRCTALIAAGPQAPAPAESQVRCPHPLCHLLRPRPRVGVDRDRPKTMIENPVSTKEMGTAWRPSSAPIQSPCSRRAAGASPARHLYREGKSQTDGDSWPAPVEVASAPGPSLPASLIERHGEDGILLLLRQGTVVPFATGADQLPGGGVLEVST